MTRRSFPYYLAALLLSALNVTAVSVWAAAPTGLLSVASTDDQLRVIDRTTGVTQSSVTITLAGETVQGATGLTKDPTSGVLYALLRLQSAPACRATPGPGGGKQSRLVTIDPTTGIATSVGNTGDCFASITFHSNGTLYGVTGAGAGVPSTLYSLNKTTAAKTLLRVLATSDGGQAIVFNSGNGLIYHMWGFNNQNFEAINPATAFSATSIPLSGDGFIESLGMSEIPGSPNTMLFSDSGNLYTISTGGVVAVIGELDHINKGLVLLDNFAPSVSGFDMVFDGPLDVSRLNLYDVEARTLGATDVTVVGTATGAVKGSLIVDRSLTKVTFVRTGGVLPADTYTVTLRGAADAFMVNGQPFDGDGDGTAGGDFVRQFTVGATNAVVVSVPDIAVGPGQPVNWPPATGSGLPVNLSEGSGVSTVFLTLLFDPALLSITGIVPGSLPAGATLQSFDLSRPGAISLGISFSPALGAGQVTIVRLAANVPANAGYREMNLLSFEAVSLNSGTIASAADDAVHVAAYLGETTGNRGYSALDGQRVLRVATQLDSGFLAYPLLDPLIIGDTTANGSISSLDGTRILQFVAGIPTPQIPPLPASAAAARAAARR